MRNRIYELAVDVQVYRPKIRPVGLPDRGASGGYPLGSYEHFMNMEYPRDHDCFLNRGQRLSSYTRPAKPTQFPGILLASKTVRSEVLPIFYNVNRFVFYQCPLARVFGWISNVVREQKQQIRAIVWQGSFTEENALAAIALHSLEAKDVLRGCPLIYCFYGQEHVMCEIGRLVEDLFEDGPLAQRSHEDLGAMSMDMLLNGVNAQVKEWWAKHQRTDFGENYSCGCCEAAEIGAESESESGD